MAPQPITSFTPLLTAAEAFPTFERLVLNAHTEVIASFRIFDPSTQLLSEEARTIGRDWADLLAHGLRRGVTVRLTLADFDPVMAPELHKACWRAYKQLMAVAEIVGPDAASRLEVRTALHPARAGRVARAAFALAVARHRSRARLSRFAPGLTRAKQAKSITLFPATHHQKLAVIDRDTLYIGGLDLNPRRMDDTTHRRAAHQTWHDVQCVVTGPVVAAARTHLTSFQRVVQGAQDPPPATPGFLRTLARRRRAHAVTIGPKTLVQEVLDAHLHGIATARRLIYLETQFLRHRAIAEALTTAADKHPELTLIAILPAAPEDVAFEGNTGGDARLGEGLQAEMVTKLRNAFGPRAAILSPARPTPADPALPTRSVLHDAPIIYVHSKVAVFDDSRAILSSANLNGRSLLWDTEAGVELTDPGQIVPLRERLMTHWWGGTPTPQALCPDTAASLWAERATQNAGTAPEARKGFLLPYDVEAAAAFGASLPFVPEALV